MYCYMKKLIALLVQFIHVHIICVLRCMHYSKSVSSGDANMHPIVSSVGCVLAQHSSVNYKHRGLNQTATA